jgi:type IV pilus assembly protein PilA
MFQRFQAMKEEREGGFTLIELLVVIIIIAILAAIAIPVFLKQREKGWKSQAESAVKNAATAMETYGTENNGSYANANLATLTNNGFKNTTGVTTSVVSSSATAYCLKADHASLDYDIYFSSTSGAPTTTACS